MVKCTDYANRGKPEDCLVITMMKYNVKTFRTTIISFTKKQERRTSYVVSFISNKLADFEYNDEAQFIS